MTAIRTKTQRADSEYLDFNPFDEGKGDCSVECRRVKIVTTRKEHPCMASYLTPNDKKKGHAISARSRAYKESAKVDGQFATCYSCLPCLDVLLEATYGE